MIASAGAEGMGTRESGGRKVVLFVEDETFIRFWIGDRLRAAGFEVLEAADAGEALTLLEARPDVDLLFTDVRMPGEIDGVALASRVRTLYPRMRILYGTGQGVEPGPMRFADGVALKPYQPEILAKQIRQILG